MMSHRDVFGLTRLAFFCECLPTLSRDLFSSEVRKLSGCFIPEVYITEALMLLPLTNLRHS